MNHKNPQIVLASASPSRREFLSMIGIKDFEVCPAIGDEKADESLPFGDIVVDIAYQKCIEVASKFDEDAVIISADTVVEIDGHILGKPYSVEEARAMLSALSGHMHTVYTGVIVKRGEHEVKKYQKTDVYMRAMSPEEIEAYIKTGEPMDKAGAYGIQGIGGIFIERVDGEYANVVGLPICLLATMLAEVGVSVL